MEKTFKESTLVYLEKTFGLRSTTECAELDQWLNNDSQLIASQKDEISLLQSLLKHNVLHWNGQELSLHFIGPLFSLARFISVELRYNIFAERAIEATIESTKLGKIRLYGKPDGIVASGYREPETPFFSFQEYKKELDPDGQPAGQVLAAMLFGQVLSESEFPIYGCYVIGQNWHFVTLVGKKYCISPAYSALTNEITFIFKALLGLKSIVEKRTEGIEI
jgi:hypothetical protein